MAVQKGKHGGKGFRYPAEIRAQAIELYHGCRGDFSSNEKAARHIAHLLGVGHHDSVLSWVRQDKIDNGLKAGLTTSETDEIRKLKRENAELKRANGILRAASAFFAAELDRPQNR